MGDRILIEEIVVDQPELVYETRIVTSNIKELLNNIEAFSRRSADSPDGKPIKFEVRRFRLQRGSVTVGSGPTALKLPMPPLALDDLGTKEGGITADQLATVLVQNVLNNVVTATGSAALTVGKSAGASMTEAAGTAVDKAGDGIKKLFSRDK